MGIANFYNKTVDTARLEQVGSSNRQEWETNLEDISVAIHPQNPELVQVQTSAFYNIYKMFCASTLDIEIGDRIVDGAVIYSVTGKSLYDDVGSSNVHMRCVLVKGTI